MTNFLFLPLSVQAASPGATGQDLLPGPQDLVIVFFFFEVIPSQVSLLLVVLIGDGGDGVRQVVVVVGGVGEVVLHLLLQP